MGKRSRPDHYTDKAKRAGFEARSVFKLKELDNRFLLIKRGAKVLDVGAAPGSWSQYAAARVAPHGSVVAVDLKAMSTIEALELVDTLVGDIYEESVITQLRERGPYDLIMSDAAPNTTGNRGVDTARSAALVEHVIWMAASLLQPGGALVAKIFQGGEERALLETIRNRFRTARLIKPKANQALYAARASRAQQGPLLH